MLLPAYAGSLAADIEWETFTSSDQPYGLSGLVERKSAPETNTYPQPAPPGNFTLGRIEGSGDEPRQGAGTSTPRRRPPRPVDMLWLKKLLMPFSVMGSFVGAVAAIYFEFMFCLDTFDRLTGVVAGVILLPVGLLAGGAIGAVAGPLAVIAAIVWGVGWLYHHM